MLPCFQYEPGKRYIFSPWHEECKQTIYVASVFATCICGVHNCHPQAFSPRIFPQLWRKNWKAWEDFTRDIVPLCRYIYRIWRWWHHRERAIHVIVSWGTRKMKEEDHSASRRTRRATSDITVALYHVWKPPGLEVVASKSWLLQKQKGDTNLRLEKKIANISTGYFSHFNWMLQFLSTWSI